MLGDELLAQWRLAARDLQQSSLPDNTLRVLLFGDANVSSSVYQFYGGLCAAARNGTALVYVRVFKSGNEVICQALRSIDDGSYPARLAFLATGSAMYERDPANPRGATPAAADRVFRALDDLDARDRQRHRAVVFTVVRDPMQHLVAGFAEMNLFKLRKTANQRHHKETHDPAFRAADSDATSTVADELVDSGGAPLDALRNFQNVTRFSAHFIERFVNGEVQLSREGNRHTTPQVAFLSRAFPARGGRACCDGRLDLVGSLENLESTWRQIGARVGAAAIDDATSALRQPPAAAPAQLSPISSSRHDHTRPRHVAFVWPPWSSVSTHQAHPITNATAGFLPRERFEHLLNDSPRHAIALCRVLLPDYVCFRYPLPPVCEEAIGPSLGGVTCALRRLPPRHI